MHQKTTMQEALPAVTHKTTYLLSSYPAVSHTFFLTEIRALREQGLDVDVISINDCDRPNERLTALERQEKANTFYLKSSGLRRVLGAHLKTVLHAPLRYLRALGYALALADGSPRMLLYRLFYFLEAVVVIQHMRRTGSRHLHVHFGSEVATVALIAKQLEPITLSLTIHGSDEFYNVSAYHLDRKIKAADFIFCISHFTASQLMRLTDYEDWDKIQVSRLGIDVEKFTPSAPGVKLHDDINILCVSRLTLSKGLHLLLQACAPLMQKFPQLTLTVVGDGEQRASLQRLAARLKIEDRIHFAGAVNQDQILPYYRQADIFCLPSFAEGVPVVLMEAMAMALPCVTSCINGIPELIEDGHNGRLVSAADAQALQMALNELIADPEKRQRIGQAARETVVARYNRDTNFAMLARRFSERLAACEHPGQPHPDRLESYV